MRDCISPIVPGGVTHVRMTREERIWVSGWNTLDEMERRLFRPERLTHCDGVRVCVIGRHVVLSWDGCIYNGSNTMKIRIQSRNVSGWTERGWTAEVVVDRASRVALRADCGFGLLQDERVNVHKDMRFLDYAKAEHNRI